MEARNQPVKQGSIDSPTRIIVTPAEQRLTAIPTATPVAWWQFVV